MALFDADDTIFALSSARGRAALAVHRLSGPKCLSALRPYLRKVGNKTNDSSIKEPLASEFRHSAQRYCYIVDEGGSIVDDCLLTYFESPKSFTGEDTVEICTHGNPLISARLHSLLRRLGLREARPGEFTQRAFLNGKLDLTAAEAIDQLIHSESQAGIELARQASEGRINAVSRELKTRLTAAMAYFEAHIDFADDEVGGYDGQSQRELLRSIRKDLVKLSDSFTVGLKIREGLKVAFWGSPNAGKSSLYNALLGTERAIVTDIPGTTRDVLEDRLTLGHRDFVILDTAGIRETEDTVEKIGVARTISSAQSADLVCLIVDPTATNPEQLEESVQTQLKACEEVLSLSPRPRLLVVLTKSDCWSEALKSKVEFLSENLSKRDLRLCQTTSAQNQIAEFVDALQQEYDRILESGQGKESVYLISERQRDKTLLAIQSLDAAEQLIATNDFPEKIASMLIQTAQHISEIVGEIGTDDVLENIFSSFCIGK